MVWSGWGQSLPVFVHSLLYNIAQDQLLDGDNECTMSVQCVLVQSLNFHQGPMRQGEKRQSTIEKPWSPHCAWIRTLAAVVPWIALRKAKGRLKMSFKITLTHETLGEILVFGFRSTLTAWFRL